MKKLFIGGIMLIFFVSIINVQCISESSAENRIEYAIFKNPPLQYHCYSMWGFNLSRIEEEKMIASVKRMGEHGYGGFFISVSGANGSKLDPEFFKQAKPFLNFQNSGIEYNSPEFFRLYRAALDEAQKYGMKIVLYDDYYYPSGQVAGQFYQNYPQHMSKRLDMVEKDVTGPAKVSLSFPADTSIYIGAVMMNRDDFKRIDISDGLEDAHNFEYDVPEGNWKVMVFYLNTRPVLTIRNPGTVDYLDETAVAKFIELTYEKFYENLKDYFGSLIFMSFYDEPSMHWMLGRLWTASFNEKFKQKYGFSPMTYYPAMWYDIGKETAVARNALYGFRSQLFADAFVKQVQRWCAVHNILMSGHMDQEEVINPVSTNGDLMKLFEYQDIPGADDIFFWGRSNMGYKIVTSASFNYDKPVTMAETFAAYRENLKENTLLQTTMDQYAMGINMQVPAGSVFKYEQRVSDLNTYVGRLSYILQHGRHVSDVALLYPINSLYSDFMYKDDWEYAYNGGTPSPELDYMNIGEILYRGLRIDYTYLHPEVLDSRCSIDKHKLILNNKVNSEEYKILIIPGGTTISYSNAKKISDYYEKGGVLIFTSQIPYRSAESGLDGEVQKVMSTILNKTIDESVRGKISIDNAKGYFQTSNAKGGMAFYVPKPDCNILGTVIRRAVPVLDVDIKEPVWPIKTGKDYNGALTYIHKVKGGRDIYFFANSSERHVETEVILRGKKNLVIWNPYSGDRLAAQIENKKAGTEDVTTIQLVLPPVTSLFYLSE